MLVLFETAAGYAIFKVLNEKKLQKTENLYKEFESPEEASKIVKMKHFEKFGDMTEALSAATAAIEGKMNKRLKKILKKVVLSEPSEQLAVADTKLGNIIKEKLNISCIHNNQVAELMRCIRSQLESLVNGFPQKEMTAMALGLAHSLSRYKLKFSPDKVDTMIVQAVSLLQDLDKELNNYVMRCREWYGWHFPELGKVVTDSLVFAKTVKVLGMRENASSTDLTDVVSEDIATTIKEQAEISMGTEISDEDIMNITLLCDQVIEMSDYRNQLFEYLKNRMSAIAPNLTILVGELVGARLISHAGSLLNLSKQPASTVQILGAEKALFRALKTKHATPKYGILYHSQIVGQSAAQLKGKAARKLAAKVALCVRYDALADETNSDLGLELKAKLELDLKNIEEGSKRQISGTGRMKAKMDKYEAKSEVRPYKPGADITRKRKFVEEVTDEAEASGSNPSKKFKKEVEDVPEETLGSSKKKRKAQAQAQAVAEEEVSGSVKKKKKKGQEQEQSFVEEEASGSVSKKIKSEPVEDDTQVLPKKKSKKAPKESDDTNNTTPRKKKKKSKAEAE